MKEAQALEAVAREMQQLAKEVRALEGAEATRPSKPRRPVRDRAKQQPDSAFPWVVGFAVGGFVLYYYVWRPAQQAADAPAAPTTPGTPSTPAPVSPAPPAVPATIGQGSRGEGVRTLQRLLVATGYGKYLGPSQADGVWGNATTDALTALVTNYNTTAYDRIKSIFVQPPKTARQTRLTPGLALVVLSLAMPKVPLQSLSGYAQQLSAGTLTPPTLSTLFKL
jgi:hypothetical protein